MTFQASDDKRRNFLDLLDDDLNTIEPIYSKEGSWLDTLTIQTCYALELQEPQLITLLSMNIN